uniref:Uncharacterized protein n=1 Tax=Fagus sylvatica TaxID=28930 RepID=A0A2N9FR05_FAGSY
MCREYQELRFRTLRRLRKDTRCNLVREPGPLGKRLIQGLNSFGNTDFSSMSWFPNMTVPPKFKAPEFEKYNGRGDPMIHLQMYCRKMAPYADNEPLLIQTFQDTLTGNAAEWYSQLKKISHWKELADTFLAQYGFNSQIAPDRFDLQRMEKKSNETFREYAQRWREKAARARPPLDEREMIKIFVDTLKNPYFDRMMGLQMQFFVDLIPVGDRIEDALKTKKNSGHDGPNGISRTGRQESSDKEEGRRCANDREKQRKTKAKLYPILIEKSLISPIVPKPYSGPQRRDFNPNSACDFHFGEVGHTVENCGQLRHRVQDLIDHGVLKFEGLPNITTNPLPKHPEGGVNMVEVEEGNEESIAWRRLFYTLEKQKHITPLDAPPGPSTGDACEYHSGGERAQPRLKSSTRWTPPISTGTRRSIWMTSWKDEMDLDNLQDEEADWGYFMEDDTDEWRDVDFTEFFQFPCLIVPPGFVTPEFEIFYEDGDPEVHLQKYGEKMALHLENELLMISVFPESLSKQAAAWFYQLRNLTGWDDLKKEKSQSRHHHQATSSPPPLAEEEYAGPMVEGLSIHTIALERRIPPPHHRPATANREKKSRRGLAYHCYSVSRVVMSKRITRKTSNDPHVSKIDNKTDCSLDNIDNSDEEIELPSDILEALERQDEGSKPNIEELEIVNLANEGEEPREVKIGTRCAAEQKEALIALLREFHEIFAWSYQDMPGLDTDIVVHKIPLKARMQARQASTATDEARSHFEDQGRGGKAIEGRTPEPLIQRAMVTLFHDMIHHEIEVYVDDMIAKSRTAQDHLTDLRKLFQRLKKYQLRLNPNKCAFGVTSGKLLGFIVSGRGIEIDPAKTAREAFDKIKEYLLNPPILVPPTPGRPLILYLTVQEASMGCMLGQQDETGKKEQAIYYLSKKFTEPETRYLLVEKTCCALAWASKKLRQYMLYYTTWLVSRMDPIKYIFEKPALTGKIARWQVLLSEFDILFVARKAIKGQAIADYLADYPSEQLELMDFRVPRRRLSQTNGEWQARDPKLIPYQRYISRLIPKFKYVTFTYTPRAHNHFADALATLASLIKLVEGDDVRPLRIETRDIPAYCVCIEECMNVEAEIDDKPCSFLSGEILYKRTHDATLLRCVDAEEANRLIQEMHAGLMGAHANGPFLARKIMRAGYYWLTMERDCIRHVQTCHKCQMYQNSKNAPPQYLHTMASPWPFSAWGMDVIGAITPKASNGHEFILVAIDYFTKWVEACSFKNVTQVAVTRFVKNNIICRYGMPENAHHRQCFQPKQPHDGSAMPAVQDPAPQLCSIPSEDERSRRSCQQELRTSVGATPYSLVYGMEAVLPVEVEIPSLRILSQTQLEEAEWAQARYEQLNFIDEKRLAALCHGQLYQRRIERAYNKKARPRTFQPGDLVLKKRNMALSDPRGKFAPSYEGPYVVKKAFSGGAIILADMDGEEFRSPINSDSVIKYHV